VGRDAGGKKGIQTTHEIKPKIKKTSYKSVFLGVVKYNRVLMRYIEKKHQFKV
jgi:hypothetical protein